MSITWKPVPKTSASASISRPDSSTTECGLIAATPSVTSSTLSRASAGYQALDGRMRLQPTV